MIMMMRINWNMCRDMLSPRLYVHVCICLCLYVHLLSVPVCRKRVLCPFSYQMDLDYHIDAVTATSIGRR